MMITPETIEKIRKFKKIHSELMEELDAYGVYADNHLGEIGLPIDTFFKEFPQYETGPFRPDLGSPLIFRTEVDGITFFALGGPENIPQEVAV